MSFTFLLYIWVVYFVFLALFCSYCAFLCMCLRWKYLEVHFAPRRQYIFNQRITWSRIALWSLTETVSENTYWPRMSSDQFFFSNNILWRFVIFSFLNSFWKCEAESHLLCDSILLAFIYSIFTFQSILFFLWIKM